MKRKIIFISVMFALIICFIWGNSLLSPDLSARLSQAVGELLASVLGEGDGGATVGGLPVRKVAHFVEFCALGAVAALLLRILVNPWKLRLFAEAFIGLFVPVIDETLQLFSGRGSSVRDVWIDIFGYTFGCIIIYLSGLLIEKIKNRVKNNHKF